MPAVWINGKQLNNFEKNTAFFIYEKLWEYCNIGHINNANIDPSININFTMFSYIHNLLSHFGLVHFLPENKSKHKKAFPVKFFYFYKPRIAWISYSDKN